MSMLRGASPTPPRWWASIPNSTTTSLPTTRSRPSPTSSRPSELRGDRIAASSVHTNPGRGGDCASGLAPEVEPLVPSDSSAGGAERVEGGPRPQTGGDGSGDERLAVVASL